MSDQSTHKNLYHKLLDDTLTEKELDLLKQSGDLPILERIISETDTWSLPKPKKSYQDLKSTLPKQPSKKEKVIRLQSFLRIAASVILFLGVAYVAHYRFFDATEYYTLAQETKSVVLPDGSRVTLNSNSSIRFNNYNWEENRRVEVIGQAYFDVEKNKGTFKVDFLNGFIQVLGTQFDVFSHKNFTTINCYEGKIATSVNNSEFTLTAHKGVKFDGKMTKEITIVDEAPTWISNFTSFNKAPLKEVLSALSMKYGINYILDLDIENKKIFTGQFINDDLDIALEMVLTPLSLSYSKSGEIVHITEK
ncbi:MAG: FecR family protein [Flavobacteriaceae bacterium]